MTEVTITETELAEALRRMSYASALHAGNIVKDVLKHRKTARTAAGPTPPRKFTGEPVSVTRNELEAALSSLSYGGPVGKPVTFNSYYSTCSLAYDLLAHVKNNKEPEWQEGDVVKDAFGIFWQRRDGSQWEKFGSNVPFSDGAPRRPLEGPLNH